MSIELFIATFENEESRANEVLQKMKAYKKEGLLHFEHAAVIVKPKEGEVEVNDVSDVDSKHGAIFGAITGALVGSLGGPVGTVVGAVAGAATGGVTAKLADYGISNDMIEETEKLLPPGSSAIITYVEMNWADKAVNQLEKNGATVMRETIDVGAISGYGRANLA